MNHDTLPLIPDSVAVGLQNDIIQYYNELKFNLLFFNEPIAILSTPTFDNINNEIVSLVKAGKPLPATALGEPSYLRNYQIIATDEWEELMSYCIEFQFTMEIFDKIDSSKISNELEKQIDNIVPSPFGTYLSENDKEYDWNNEHFQIMKRYVKIQMHRLESILDHCYDNKISMIWSNEVDTSLCQIYLKKMIKEQEANLFNRKNRTKVRQLLGQELLKEILNFQVINISAVPTDKIVDFKKRNQDLLNNFLVYYREFLSTLQAEPKKYIEITEKYSQSLSQKLQDINNEILILKNARKYKWMNLISEEAFDSAKKGLPVGIWGLLSNPYSIAFALGIKLIELGGKALGFKLNKDEKLKTFILNSSAGYIWKAKETFK